MKNLKLSLIILLGASTLALTSCTKVEVEETVTGEGSVSIELDHVWGMGGATEFKLDTFLVQPMTQDSLKFTTFKYYVSNFKLKKSDGSYWVHPNSYFLVDLSNPESLELNFSGIPAGSYTDLIFTLGVDSLRNVSGAQTGALATTNQMFWSWNSGYIMLKAEGISPQSTASNETFVFHLGGFSGDNNIVTEKTLSLAATPLTVTANAEKMIHMQMNPGWLWHSSPSVSVTNKIHMPGTSAKNMAKSLFENNSFVVHHIH
jgi:hypothetical protein